MRGIFTSWMGQSKKRHNVRVLQSRGTYTFMFDCGKFSPQDGWFFAAIAGRDPLFAMKVMRVK
ncbi:MAG: hypothetical protein JW807_15585 [Spirochaetes bacterium]|nr:hypothetical protein [Spirochaetota bacterium]